MSSGSSQHNTGISSLVQNLPFNRGTAFGVIILTALFSFELFNYSTTDFALTDLLGDLRFAGLRWATILSIAFCGIDFAGIARLFTPEGNRNTYHETWYLFGAWLLAATMNAMLTWWGVSLAVINHSSLGNAIVERQTLMRAVPIFVALLVWLIRVLIIGTFSAAGDHLFQLGENTQPRQVSRQSNRPPVTQNASLAVPARPFNQRPAAPLRAENSRPAAPRTTLSNNSEAAHTPAARLASQARPMRVTTPPPPESPPDPVYSRPEPTYQPLYFNNADQAEYEMAENPRPRQNSTVRKF